MHRFQLPNGSKHNLKSLKKRSGKLIFFRCRFVINLGWIREPQTIPKRRPGCPQVPPGHSWNTSCAPPGPTKLPELDFRWFQLDLGSILEGFVHQNGSQSVPKHTKSASWLLPLYPRPLSPQPPSLQPPLSPIGLGGIREA